MYVLCSYSYKRTIISSIVHELNGSIRNLFFYFKKKNYSKEGVVFLLL
jgi:hypothetical protein